MLRFLFVYMEYQIKDKLIDNYLRIEWKIFLLQWIQCLILTLWEAHF